MSVANGPILLTVGCLLAPLAVTACAQLPHEGPSRAAVESAQDSNNTSGFVLIDIDRKVANYLAQVNEPSLGDKFGKGKPAKVGRIGSGDVLQVKIWEADLGGLFGTAGTVDRGEIPNVVVDARGNIQIPYAGSIRARGHTPSQLARAITERLKTKTVEPQTHVVVTKNVANVVTISGNVGAPGIYPLSMRGDTLLDIIAAAGGSRSPSYETMIRYTRGKNTGVTYLDLVLRSQPNNLYAQPGDKIHVERKPKTYSAFGAVSKKGKHDFLASKLSLLEAVGNVSGLSDSRADPTGVFMMRFEPVNRAYDLVGTSVPEDAAKIVPVIYRLDLQDPNQYFFAQSISMRDKDVIYVANAPAVELEKFLTIVGKGVGSVSAGTSLVNKVTD